MDPSQPLYRWRFGTAEFDEARHELRVGGLPVSLESKPLEVLAVLLRHAGEVVTKRELLETVWRDRVTVEHVLATAVGKLRQALGPGANGVVLTVPRHGYRLDAAVQRVAVGRVHVSDLDLTVGQPVPNRSGAVLSAPLGQSHHSEVWLAQEASSAQQRVFKFATTVERLGLLKREATVARILRETLGPRADIVQVLDWNFEQAPFFLECEYGGSSLSVWANAGHLARQSRQERLALFLRAARAVEAAHRVGVLHKDIKPDNLLIDTDAALRITDFGSSRLLDPEQLRQLGITGPTATLDGEGQGTDGTLLYLAPEILDGQPATIRSDLYALGVLLYQMLIGDLKRPLTPGWEQLLDDALLLEDIRRATDMTPERRFSSVTELIERLDALTERRAAAAAAGAAAIQAARERELLSRLRARRPWVAGALISLSLGLASSLWLLQETRSARAEFEREAARAEAVSRFLSDDILGGANPGAAGFERNPSIRELLDRAASGLDNRFGDDPLTAAGLREALGRAYHTIGARSVAAEHYDRAAALYTEVDGKISKRTIVSRYSQVRSLAHTATPQSLADAQALLSQTDTEAQSLAISDPEVSYRAALARGDYHFQRMEIAPARSALETAFQLQRRLHPDDLHAAAWIRGTLADTVLRGGDAATAERLIKALMEEPRITAQSLGGGIIASQEALLARALRAQARYEEALKLATSAANIYQDIHGEHAYLTITTKSLVASILDASGNCPAALEIARDVDARMQAVFGNTNQAALVERGNLGFKELECGDTETGIHYLEIAEATLRESFGTNNVAANSFRYGLAAALTDRGRHQEALVLLDRVDPAAMTAAESSSGWPHRLQALRGQVIYRLGDAAQGRALVASAMQELLALGADASVLARFNDVTGGLPAASDL